MKITITLDVDEVKILEKRDKKEPLDSQRTS